VHIANSKFHPNDKKNLTGFTEFIDIIQENLKPVEPVLKKEDKKVENEEPAPGPEVSESGYGSEHRVNGIGYPLEVHLVHYNTKYKGNFSQIIHF